MALKTEKSSISNEERPIFQKISLFLSTELKIDSFFNSLLTVSV